jgi:hypothetical protein
MPSVFAWHLLSAEVSRATRRLSCLVALVTFRLYGACYALGGPSPIAWRFPWPAAENVPQAVAVLPSTAYSCHPAFRRIRDESLSENAWEATWLHSAKLGQNVLPTRCRPQAATSFSANEDNLCGDRNPPSIETDGSVPSRKPCDRSLGSGEKANLLPMPQRFATAGFGCGQEFSCV